MRPVGQVCRGGSPEFRLNAPLPDVRPLQEPTGAPCCPLCLLQPACPAAGPAAAAKPLAPGAAGRGGAGARSRGLTSPPGLLGVGTAAVRLTCSGGGEQGVQLCPCARAWLGARTAVSSPATANAAGPWVHSSQGH